MPTTIKCLEKLISFLHFLCKSHVTWKVTCFPEVSWKHRGHSRKPEAEQRFLLDPGTFPGTLCGRSANANTPRWRWTLWYDHGGSHTRPAQIKSVLFLPVSDKHVTSDLSCSWFVSPTSCLCLCARHVSVATRLSARVDFCSCFRGLFLPEHRSNDTFLWIWGEMYASTGRDVAIVTVSFPVSSNSCINSCGQFVCLHFVTLLLSNKDK